MKKIIIAAVIAVAFVAQAEAAQKYDVVHVTGSTAPIDCPAIFDENTLNANGEPVGPLPPLGIRDCNVSDGTIVVRNNKRGPTKFSVDTTASWPEYE